MNSKPAGWTARSVAFHKQELLSLSSIRGAGGEQRGARGEQSSDMCGQIRATDSTAAAAALCVKGAFPFLRTAKSLTDR